MIIISRLLLTLAIAGLAPTASAATDSISGKPFGTMPDGTPIMIYTLRNTRGAEARITNYGGIVVSLKMPDRTGSLDDVVLGYDSLKDYLCDQKTYFGALIGRYGNRIALGRFSLDGKTYQLAINNPPNALHGGIRGFNRDVWHATPLLSSKGPALELSLVSPNGDQGYPGKLSVTAIYTLTNNNELRIDFTAITDSDTIINLTHHSYFNLSGAGHGDILGHKIRISARGYTPIDSTSIPLGQVASVKDTPFDFTRLTPIGARINEPNQQLTFAHGYDHNFVLDHPYFSGGVREAARVVEPKSGRTMEVLTNQPGVQFYTGNFLDGTNIGKGGLPYKFRYGFCLEPQHFPNSPNQPHFPSVVLHPGETYHNTIVYRFGYN